MTNCWSVRCSPEFLSLNNSTPSPCMQVCWNCDQIGKTIAVAWVHDQARLRDMPTITVTAPAKVNLYLEVLGRENNGFHLLETVFQTVGLSDEITITCGTGGGIVCECDDVAIPSDERNLAWRAANAFCNERPTELGGIQMSVLKRIPSGAGLGGGSSDAAAVLRGLSQLFPDRHDMVSLQEIAAQLGADVPFFLTGGTALGTNRGDVLQSLPALAPAPLTLLMPNAMLPTPTVFQALMESERGPRAAHGYAWWEQQLQSGQWPTALLFNRLTGPAARLCQPLQTLLDWIASEQLPGCMTGSGAACFVFGHVNPPPGIRFWHTSLLPPST